MKTSPSLNRRRAAAAAQWTARWWLAMLAVLVGSVVAVSAHAQAAADPPSRVARLSDVAGQVWLYSPDSNEWITVDRNRPLTTGDRLATDNGARAEVTLGTTTLRLDAATELEIARLDDARFQVRLVSGSVAARLRTTQSLAEFSIETDEGRFRAQTVGRFRFDRFERTSDVTVLAGQAIYEARNTALPVTTGQHAQFWVDAAGVPQYAMVALAHDDFAAWNDDRDRTEDRFATNRYVSPEMTGAEDLDRYGSWQDTPDDGPLWIPREVPVGWAPYTTGHWAWVRPWGWTWVDDAAWGFAPFHYGRWVYRRDTWCWAPGRYVARPVYAPALVAWIGAPRADVSISIGGGGPAVGWFPLAPHEVYVPWYRTSPRYAREVNITHVTNVTNITNIINNRNGEADRREFANRRIPQAVTFVPAEVVARRQPVAPVAQRFRNDPQFRALVAGGAPERVVTAPPLAAPPAAPRSPQGRPPPRPPFESRGAAGAMAGRPDAVRPNAGRGEPVRPEVGAAQPGRADAGRAEGSRVDAGRADGARIENGRANNARPDIARGSERGAPLSQQPPRAMTPPVVGASPAPAAPPAAPPVGARGVLVEPSAVARPPLRGGEPGRDAAAIPPSPVQRNGATAEGGRPTFRGRDMADEERNGTRQTVPGGPRPQVREVAPALREVPPVPRSAPVQRAPEAVVVPPQQRPAAAPPSPAPVAPAAPPVVPQAQQPHGGEHRMTRPEQPRGDEDRRERGERQR